MITNYDVEERRLSRMKSDDRVLVLRPTEGLQARAADLSVDKGLFTGENNLHAVYDTNKGLWTMKYDRGALPGGLQNQFTLFSELLAHARVYFKKRNISIVEVRE